MKEKTCPACGKVYFTKNKYCSKKCNHNAIALRSYHRAMRDPAYVQKQRDYRVKQRKELRKMNLCTRCGKENDRIVINRTRCTNCTEQERR